jgi:hypothetical protein
METLRELVFVAARGQNAFFGELSSALRHELAALGVATDGAERFPEAQEGRVSVLLAPHEFAALAPPDAAPSAGDLRRTVSICTEQPGTKWFELGGRFARASGAVLDINGRGVRELSRRGIKAAHLQLGYTPLWERRSGGARGVDVCFLGGASERRCRALSQYGGELWRHRCRLVFADNAVTQTGAAPGFVSGEEKLDLLADSRLLLNLHRDDRPYFEWQRVLEAVHCGALVVSEHSTDVAPLVPGEHFLSGDLHSLHHLAARVLRDEDFRASMSAAALATIKEKIPMRRAAELIADRAEELLGHRRPRLPRRPPPLGEPSPEQSLRSWLASLRPRDDDDLQRAAAKRFAVELRELKRRVDALERAGSPVEAETDHLTPAYAYAEPAVSVVVPLFDHADHVVEALDSVAASRFREIELIVVDDASTDDSRRVARDWLEAHTGIAAALVHHPVNRGLPATRNKGIELARGEMVLPLDSDNTIYPSCIERLTEALAADRDAAFAFGILEQFEGEHPVGLSGQFGWDTERLAVENYIDALALVRRSALDKLGGYSTDPRLYGWEDYDLWCRIAERGWHGAHVPEIIARYRLAPQSMISLTNLSDIEAREALAERSPRLLGVVPGHGPASGSSPGP